MANADKAAFFCDAPPRDDAACVAFALIAAILIHIGLYLVLPKSFALAVPKKPAETRVEIIPPKRAEYIEANPFANSQVPDTPAPESYKSQQARDIITDPSARGRRPHIDGEVENGNKIVSGTSSPEDTISPTDVFDVLERPLADPLSPSETESQNPAEKSEQQSQAQKTDFQTASATPRGENNPKKNAAENPTQNQDAKNQPPTAPTNKLDSQNVKFAEDSNSAYKSAPYAEASAQTQPRPSPETLPADTPKTPDTPHTQPAPVKKPQTNPSLPTPRKRARLSMKIPAGTLAKSPARVSRQGLIAADSRFSEFGAYLQRMLEAVSRQWNLLGTKYDLSSAIGSRVGVEYSVDSTGRITDFKILFSDSTNTGRALCEQAILSTAPYGEWTREMFVTFAGKPQSVKIIFYYK